MKKATIVLATLALTGSAFACTPEDFPLCRAKCSSGTLCAPPAEPTADGQPDAPPARPTTTVSTPAPADDPDKVDEPVLKHRHRPEMPGD